ncbi:MAG: hypothetical protein RLZZ324_974 [Candidatus Parcubacteria bacterium]|jgi:hypothetical protein
MTNEEKRAQYEQNIRGSQAINQMRANIKMTLGMIASGLTTEDRMDLWKKNSVHVSDGVSDWIIQAKAAVPNTLEVWLELNGSDALICTIELCNLSRRVVAKYGREIAGHNVQYVDAAMPTLLAYMMERFPGVCQDIATNVDAAAYVGTK